MKLAAALTMSYIVPAELLVVGSLDSWPVLSYPQLESQAALSP